MSSKLQENLTAILTEKLAKVKPENIKYGQTIFGVEGTAKSVSFKITDASYLFYNGARKEYINELLSLCEQITSAEKMFYQIIQYDWELDLSELDTSKCTNMNNMFYACSNLEKLNVSNFNTSNVRDMDAMFCACRTLTELDVSNFDTSNVRTMRYMFAALSNLTELDVSNFDTSNVTNMQYMFQYFKGEKLDLSNFDMGKITSISYMFQFCSNLTNLNSFKNLGQGYTQKSNNYSNYKLDLSPCPLSYESLIDLITNGLYDLNLTYDVANGGTLYTQSLNLGSTNLAKLTAEEIAIATARGWNVT